MGAKTTARNVALVGASGAGKTTLLESMLFVAGAIGRKGSVADGTTVGDGSAEARARQMSTEVSVAGFSCHGLDFTVLDCPGSVEFVQDAYSAALGCDAAVVVVEPVLERLIAVAPLLHFLDAHAIPHLVFINKMDRSEVRYRDLLQTLARSQRPAGGAAPVRDRPRRGPGRLRRPGQRGGARLPPRRALRRHPGAGRLSASASRPRGARCWRRWPTSTTTCMSCCSRTRSRRRS